MKVLFILGLLLHFGVIASPVDPSISSMKSMDGLEERSAAPGAAKDLVRRDQYCSINGKDGDVACRAGPGTNYSQVSTASAGHTYLFKCYKRGTCVFGICVWDRTQSGCYVSAYYTSCTNSSLPAC